MIRNMMKKNEVDSLRAMSVIPLYTELVDGDDYTANLLHSLKLEETKSYPSEDYEVSDRKLRTLKKFWSIFR